MFFIPSSPGRLEIKKQKGHSNNEEKKADWLLAGCWLLYVLYKKWGAMGDKVSKEEMHWTSIYRRALFSSLFLVAFSKDEIYTTPEGR